MTRAPRLSERMRALEEAAEIAEERARIYRSEIGPPHRDPATIAAAAILVGECEWIARLIRGRMQNRRAKP